MGKKSQDSKEAIDAGIIKLSEKGKKLLGGEMRSNFITTNILSYTNISSDGQAFKNKKLET